MTRLDCPHCGETVVFRQGATSVVLCRYHARAFAGDHDSLSVDLEAIKGRWSLIDATTWPGIDVVLLLKEVESLRVQLARCLARRPRPSRAAPARA